MAVRGGMVSKPDSVVTIGACCACAERARLVEGGACAPCVASFGPRFVRLAARLHQDEAFKMKCWNLLSARMKRRFAERFGAPDEAQTDQLRGDLPLMPRSKS
jgi:hypothetical protein